MRAWFVLVSLMLLSSPVHARMYQCMKDGKSSYQDAPCPQDSTATKEMNSDADGLKGFPWSDLRHGMTLAEVKAKIPNTEIGSPGPDESGADALLILNGLSIAGSRFQAKFIFLNNEYHYVSLIPLAYESYDLNSRKFVRIATMFKSTYGTPVIYTLEPSTVGVIRRVSGTAAWKIKNGQLWLSLGAPPGAFTLNETGSMLRMRFTPDAILASMPLH